MKGGVIISLVLVVVAALVLTFVSNQSTGMATLTSNANYGPIQETGQAYHSCSYITDNDGWDVTKTRAVKYFDRLDGMNKEAVDYCDTNTKVREYNCQDGYMVYRPVICPPRTICKEGSCVYS